MPTLSALNFVTEKGHHLLMRSIGAQDVPIVKDFLKQIATETTYTMQYVGREFESDELFAKRYNDADKNPLLFYLGVFDRERLVAYFGIRPENPTHPWESHICSFGIMVLKDYWSMGIGSYLLMWLEQNAKELGFTKIEAEVRVENKRGVDMYTRHGFLIEGTRKNAVLIDGKYYDNYYIVKILK